MDGWIDSYGASCEERERREIGRERSAGREQDGAEKKTTTVAGCRAPVLFSEVRCVSGLWRGGTVGGSRCVPSISGRL